ncbi:MAG: hypothetical protein U1E60_29635 [Reyranellaceae bacterium]
MIANVCGHCARDSQRPPNAAEVAEHHVKYDGMGVLLELLSRDGAVRLLA